MSKARYLWSDRANRQNPGFTQFGWIVFLLIAGGIVFFGVPLLLGHPFHAVCSSFEETFRPSLCQQQRVRRSPANHWIGAINRAQQAYFLEHHVFAGTLKDLEIGMRSEDELYRYQMVLQADPKQSVKAIATPKIPDVRSYSGAVFAVKNPQGDVITIAVHCGTEEPSTLPPVIRSPVPGLQKPLCPQGSISLGN